MLLDLSEQSIAEKLTKLHAAVPSVTTTFCQPHILQSAIQLTAAVVNKLSMIQSTNGPFATHPVVISPGLLADQSSVSSNNDSYSTNTCDTVSNYLSSFEINATINQASYAPMFS